MTAKEISPAIETAATYPGRPQFFANRFVRLLTKAAVAQQLGADVCWLLTLIAHQEDAIRYARAVTFWNEQLMPMCGFGSRKRLVAARAKAVTHNWLHYDQGGKAKPGRYWVCIPDDFGIVDDGPTEESSDSICCSKLERQRSDPPPESRNETEHKAPANGNGKGTPFNPIPKEKKETLSQFVFPTKSGEWILPATKLAEYQEAFSRIDVHGELLKARQWLRDRESRRKTPKGMPAFLSGWMNTATKDMPAPQRTPTINELRETYRA